MRFPVPFLAVFLAVLPACGVPTRDFVHEFSGYAVTQGTVVRVENLHLAGQQFLADGVATEIGKNGCRVTMRFGDRTKVFELDAGSVILLGEAGDYIFQPHEGVAARRLSGDRRKRRRQASFYRPGTGSDENAELLEETLVALELIEAGSYSKAEQKIHEMALRFPGNDLADSFRHLLRRRIPRDRAAPGAKALATAPDEAGEAYRRGQSLLKDNRPADALEAFERAYSLDPGNAAVTSGLVSSLKQLGLDLYSKGEWNEAITHWKRILELRPNDTETLGFLRRAKAIRKNM